MLILFTVIFKLGVISDSSSSLLIEPRFIGLLLGFYCANISETHFGSYSFLYTHLVSFAAPRLFGQFWTFGLSSKTLLGAALLDICLFVSNLINNTHAYVNTFIVYSANLKNWFISSFHYLFVFRFVHNFAKCGNN